MRTLAVSVLLRIIPRYLASTEMGIYWVPKNRVKLLKDLKVIITARRG